MPSFVVTLAGLIGWQGLLLYLLGRGGTINLPFDGVDRPPQRHLAPVGGWLWSLVVGRGGRATRQRRSRRRYAARCRLPTAAGG